MYTPGRTDKKY